MKGFKIEFMTWNDYRDIILSGPGRDEWRALYNYDCIIGGIDLDMGYLYVGIISLIFYIGIENI